MEATSFTALVERAGRWWTVRVPQVEGLATFQVRSIEQAEMMARKHIAEAIGVPTDAVRVEVRTEGSVLPAVAKALQAREAAVQAVERATRATRAAIDALLVDGSSFQEATTVLGMSPEEITELAATRGPQGPRDGKGTADADRPVGPGGLPVRMSRATDPLAVHG